MFSLTFLNHFHRAVVDSANAEADYFIAQGYSPSGGLLGAGLIDWKKCFHYINIKFI